MDPVSRKLLDMATNAQGDRPADPTLGPMDPERRKWLEEAIKSLTYDVAGRMKELIATIKSYTTEPTQEKEAGVIAALVELEYEVERIDAANDMEILGGFDPVVILALNSAIPAVQANALLVLSTAAANNPVAQGQLVARRLPGHIAEAFTAARFKDALCFKRAVLLASALSKGDGTAMHAFIGGNGLSEACRSGLKLLVPQITPLNKQAPNATEPENTDAVSALRTLLFFVETLIDPLNNFAGMPAIRTAIITRPVAEAVVLGLMVPQDDICGYSAKIMSYVAKSEANPSRTVALNHLKASGAAEAATAAVDRVTESISKEQFNDAISAVSSVQ